jgi:phosphoglycerate-specific signal transduction histidine kinase
MKLLITEKKSISFLGIQLKKSTYTIIVWSIILLLIIALLYFIYQYKNSYSVTSEAKSNLSEAEEELAIYKKKSLEREQKLRRQLQDEINKQRGA